MRPKQVEQLDAEHTGEALQHIQAGVHGAPLDPSDMRGIDLGIARQGLD